MTCRPGSMIGRELIAGRTMGCSGPSALSTAGGSFACSLPKAITEPEKVMAPMMMPSPISKPRRWWMCPSGSVMPKSAGERKAPIATNTAARPTSEWNAATSCGIAVISMRWAIT